MPRILTVDLARSAPGGGPASRRGGFEDPDPALARLGAVGGEALALALLLAHARSATPATSPFVLAVGDAVRRGLPTAARATLAARSPLGGLLADGQVGGDLGRRLAAVCDALVLEGRAGERSLLVIDGEGAARRLPAPFGPDTPPVERIARSQALLGSCAALVAGPAAERGVAFANLASGEPTSFVGRGGLGAALAARGVVALCVAAEPVPDAPDGALGAILAGSPRLRARSAGGTLELLHAFAARGDLGARGGEAGARLVGEARAAARERHGCKGCPTPCGWVFETAADTLQGARFNAVQALGVDLGLERFEDSLALLAVCDRAGVDAREAGALLRVALDAGEGGPGPRAQVGPLVRLLERLLADPRAAGGAAAFARLVGVEDPVPRARGLALRPERSPAALLGQCVSARGADPMRSASHVLLDAGDRRRLAELVAPLGLPPGAEDPLDPVGKGRLVAWSEALSAAVDTSGFCAFSAGALLADGLLDLDGLARRLLPDAPAEGAGRRLLALGASVCLAARELERRWGAQSDVDRPAWAAALLEHPALWPEYRRARGLDAQGRPLPEVWARLGEPSMLEPCEASFAAETPSPAREMPRPAARRVGAVGLRAVGPLGEALAALGPEPRLELELPATLEHVLATLAERLPEAGAGLVRAGRPVALAYRDGRRLAADEPVHAGDVLDLVVAIGGG